MKKIKQIPLVCAFFLACVAPCSASGIEMYLGDVAVMTGGTIALPLGGQICFGDSTCMQSAIGGTSTGSVTWGNIGGLISNQTDLLTLLDLEQNIAQKGMPYGYAGLDANGHVPLAQLPEIVTQDIAAVWGEITGLIENQTDLQNALNSKEDKANRSAPGGYAPLDDYGKVPPEYLPETSITGNQAVHIRRMDITESDLTWKTQGDTWEDFPGFSLTFEKSSDITYLRVTWSDNVGIYKPVWCNVGLFLDDSETPFCGGSWSSPYNNLFGQQTLKCLIQDVPSGSHTIYVKHRSQYCMYGNFAFDEYGLNRYVMAEEVATW